GCGATTSTKMSGAFATCAKADLGQIVESNGTTLLGDVAQKIEGNDPALEADLSALAVTAGLDAVECAVTAVLAVLEPQTKTTGQPLPGTARARAWVASQHGSAGK